MYGWRKRQPAGWCHGFTGWAVRPRTIAGARSVVPSSIGTRATSHISAIGVRLLIWPSYIHSALLLFIPEAAGLAVIAVDLSIICNDCTTRYSKGVSFSTSYTKGISTQRICNNTARLLFQLQ